MKGAVGRTGEEAACRAALNSDALWKRLPGSSAMARSIAWLIGNGIVGFAC